MSRLGVDEVLRSTEGLMAVRGEGASLLSLATGREAVVGGVK